MPLRTFNFAVFAFLLGMAAPFDSFAQSDAEAALELRERITVIIDGARCNNIVNCRVLGLGSRPCGGPEEYVAFSIWDTQIDEIKSLAAEYNFLREEVDAASGNVGTCNVLTKPAVNCVNAHCVTVPSPAAGSHPRAYARGTCSAVRGRTSLRFAPRLRPQRQLFSFLSICSIVQHKCREQ